MRRIALILAALAAGAALVATTAFSAGEEGAGQRYWVEMDNAFGLIEGGDVKIAGVRAGQIKSMEVDQRTYRAKVEIDIAKGGFGSVRSDVFCEARPQSLIGEYFLDCKPGTSPRVLKKGSTIPVEQTASTVSVDLVNNIMRRPFRERFSILLSELGAGLAARGDDLNETIRRLNPALRETDKVLAILAEQRHVIRDLTANAERVLTRLAANRKDVTRFTAEARDTSAATAERADDLARQFNRFPTFLRELRPTMASLEDSADAQIPALRNLNANAEELEAFFKALAPFSDASRPATRALASAARAGRPALRAARPRIGELRSFARPLPEVTRNLTYVLEDLDDRGRSVEKDPRSPGGQGYTGIEAILQYVFNQSQAINLFDNNSYILKVSAFFDRNCADYTDAQEAKNPAMDRCAAILGPSRPGINQPDPSDQVAGQASERVEARRDAEALDAARRAAGPAPAPGGDGPSGQEAPAARRPGVAEAVEGLLGGRLPDVKLPQGAPPLPQPGEPLQGETAAGLLDYLLGQ